MTLIKRKLLKKDLFSKSAILIFGSIALISPVFSIPVEFDCLVTGSYGVKNRVDLNKKRKKVYPTKLSKNISEKFEKFKVIFDTNKGMGTINDSEAKIISSKIDVSKDIGPIISPVVLYSSGANYGKNQIKEGNIDSGNFKISTIKNKNIEKRYLIIDKGNFNFSKFTLINIFDNAITNIVVEQNKKSFDTENNILHETYYGSCRHPKN